jgi:hypothetical protein
MLSTEVSEKNILHSTLPYGNLQRSENFIHIVYVMHELKEPDKENAFSSAGGLHTLFQGLYTFLVESDI